MLGQKIGKKSKIKIGTYFSANKVEIGDSVRIGPFCVVKAEEILLGDHCNVKALSIVSTRIIRFGCYVHIAPLSVINSEYFESSVIEIGDHSRLFPFCWLDSGYGIFIGKNVGIGGHTLIFTHGAWTNYIDGGPVSFGPVRIEDNVWLPWRIFIMPNVTIGKDSIVGANSLVNKSFSPNVLIGGNPAKIIKENIIKELLIGNWIADLPILPEQAPELGRIRFERGVLRSDTHRDAVSYTRHLDRCGQQRQCAPQEYADTNGGDSLQFNPADLFHLISSHLASIGGTELPRSDTSSKPTRKGPAGSPALLKRRRGGFGKGCQP